MTFNRRKMLIGSGVGIVGSLCSVPSIAQEKNKKLPTDAPAQWDATYQVVIIGAGGGGLGAAVSAAQNGQKGIVVLEKMPFPGGNTAICGGGMNAVDDERQKAQGIKDSTDLHFEHTIKGGDYRGNPVLIRELVENAPDTVKWLESIGVKFKPKLYQVYGSLYLRGHAPYGSLGADYIKALVEKCREYGIPIETNTKVVSVIRETPFSGKVLGVEVIKNGKPFYIQATKAVIVAAGGFGANKEMRALHDPRMANLTTTNHVGATGDLIPLLVDIGADLTGMDHIQCNPGCPPGRTHRVPIHQGGRFIIVGKDGRRFIREDERRDVIRDAVLAQPNATAWGVLDQTRFDMINQGQKEAAYKGLETGDCWKANTIEELAKKMGVDPQGLKKQVDEFNEGVKEKKDKLGKYERNLFPIVNPPFWGAYVGMSVHHTMGGVVINKESQVLDRKGQVIPDLYAVGEVTGGIHGANRLGGNAVADTLTFGRLVGKRITEQK